MDDKSLAEPVAKRAKQLVVGDRILQEYLPSAFFDGPGKILFIRTNVARNSVSVFFEQDNGHCDCQTFVLDGPVKVYPAPDPTGQLYSRADDGEPTQPIAGRVPPHFEDGRSVVEVAGGRIEVDPPEGFVPAGAGTLEPIHHGLLNEDTACGLPAAADRRQVSVWAGVTCKRCLELMPGSAEGFVPASAPLRHCPNQWHDSDVGDTPKSCPTCRETDETA